MVLVILYKTKNVNSLAKLTGEANKEASFLLYICIQYEVYAVTKSRIIISILDVHWFCCLCGRFSMLNKIYMKLRCIEAYRTRRLFNTWTPRKSHIPRSRYSFASISVSTYFTQWVWEKWKKLQNFTLILMTSMALLKYFFISVYWRYYWRFDRTCRSIEQGHSERTRLVIVCNSFVGFFCRYVFDQSV